MMCGAPEVFLTELPQLPPQTSTICFKMHYFAVKKRSQAQTTAKHKQLQKPALQTQA